MPLSSLEDMFSNLVGEVAFSASKFDEAADRLQGVHKILADDLRRCATHARAVVARAALADNFPSTEEVHDGF